MLSNASTSIVDYGADPSGISDSTSAIQSAINSGAKQIVFPDGTYKTTSTITISSGNPLRIIGEGQARINSTATGEIINVDSGSVDVFDEFVIENIIVSGDGTNTTKCLRIDGRPYGTSQVKDCIFIGASQIFVDLNDCWSTEVINCQFGPEAVSRKNEDTIGIKCNVANAIAIRDTSFNQISRTGKSIAVQCLESAMTLLDNCTIEKTWGGVKHTATSPAGVAVSVVNGYFETPSLGIEICDANGNFTGTYQVSPPSGYENFINLNNVKGGVIANNWMSIIGNINYPIILLTNCYGVNIYGNSSPLSNGEYVDQSGASRNNVLFGNNRITGKTTVSPEDYYAAYRDYQTDAFFVPAGSFSIASGSTASFESNSNVSAIVCPTAVDAPVYAYVEIPRSWGECDVEVTPYFCVNANNPGTAVMYGSVNVSSVGSVIGTTGDSGFSVPMTSYTALTLKREKHSGGSSIYKETITSPFNRMIVLKGGRDGADASDGISQSVLFIGMRVERVNLNAL